MKSFPYKILAVNFILVVLLLLAIEGLCYLSLSKDNRPPHFFIKFNKSEEIKAVKRFGFHEINPVWGWNMSEAQLHNLGFEVEKNCIVLKSNAPLDTALRIYITGGSTSDIALIPDNWPVYLHHLLEEQNMPHIIYVAAVGGFNSSQEYLRLIQEGLALKPHIHISYSGANEADDYGYATQFELDFYEMNLPTQGTLFLPNTYLFLTQKLNIKFSPLSLSKIKSPDTTTQFILNLKLMQAAAKEFEYKHIGILQPLNGFGKYISPTPQNLNAAYFESYKSYYGNMQNFISTYEGTLYDFTGIFDTATQAVYVDDCHLLPPYQKVVAQHVFEKIWRKKFPYAE